MLKIVTFLLIVILSFFSYAKPKQTIYVAVLQTQNYVVGAANPPSGLHRYERDSSWTHLGWRNARNFGVAIDPSHPDYIFLACGNGVMRSLDGGQSWRITTDWCTTEILDVAINPFKPDHVYIATAYGAWRTTDRGETWIASNEGLKPAFVQTIAVDQSTDDRVVIGGEGGLFLSINGTKNWHKIGPPNVAVRDIQQSSSSPQLWIAGAEDQGVIISEDNGKSWRFAKGSISSQTIYAVTIDPFNPKRIAAGGYQTGVFISTDGGNKWTQQKKGLPVLDIHALIFDLEKSGRLWIGALGAGVYYSDDLGRTWIYAGLKGADVWNMVIVKRD